MKALLSPGVRSRGALLTLLVLVLLLALPVAVWLDLRNLSETSLRRQASDLNSVITGIRGYYASHIVGRALASLRQLPNQEPTEVSWSLFTDRVRHVAPIVMGTTCVACHNTHPDSPKRDWKVGDVRGIQEVAISVPITANIFSFKCLLIYFLFTAAVG